MRSSPSRIASACCLIALPAILGADSKAWKPADPEYRIELPRDHGEHPRHKIEWWYYTGNLQTAEGREFGYQLTFFRVGVRTEATSPSRWALRNLYMAHLAISDLDGEEFHHDEKINRGALGWAGARVRTDGQVKIWNQSWSAMIEGDRHKLEANSSTLEAGIGTGFGIDLELLPTKNAVFHGAHGFSQKGSDASNASHYYSFTRMKTSGQIKIRSEAYEVTGTSWMDHEFGSSFLEKSQIGWDWFSLILDDGRELMLFQIRGRDTTTPPRRSGTLIEKNGDASRIADADLRFLPSATWHSPKSGAEYPTEWIIECSKPESTLTVRAAMQAQELSTPRSTGVNYWEGSVRVTGKLDGREVRGRGYLEMTGYDRSSMGELLK